MKFIDYLEKIKDEKPVNYTEYVFNSNDTQVYGYYTNEAYSKKFTGWNYGIKTDRYYSTGTIAMDLKMLLSIRDNIIQQKDKFIKPLAL